MSLVAGVSLAFQYLLAFNVADKRDGHGLSWITNEDIQPSAIYAHTIAIASAACTLNN